MESLAGARIFLTPRPVQDRPAVLEVALLGHYPSRGRVRLDRLLALGGALDDLRSAGYGNAVDALINNRMSDGTPLTPQLSGLFHLPVSLRSSAEFHDIFPDAEVATDYRSLLAGDQAWLAQSVDDFFANGGEKLWVVRVPESEGIAGFLPVVEPVMHDIDTLRGIAIALVIPSIAVIAMPDLERMQIPARLPDVPRVRLDNPDPEFLPCNANLDDGSRERRDGEEISALPEPRSLPELLRGILQLLTRHRPDMQCLFTLPLTYSSERGSPMVDTQALQFIRDMRALENGDGAMLRHMQFLFPYLRGPRFDLRSPVGAVAGKQAGVAKIKGPWHSIGAQPLAVEGQPYPRQSIAQTLTLRDDPGVGVLTVRTGLDGRARVSLDDERLVVPALPFEDYAGDYDRVRLDGFCAAEIMRFLGFLQRQLRALGEQLVFNISVDDPRPRLLLEQFFRNLYQRGALRGRVAEEGYRIEQSQPVEGAIQFDIEIAPAFPIDRIFLTFINVDGEWQGGIGNG